MDTGAALLFDRDNPYQPIPRRRARLTPIKACIALKPLPRRATDVGAEVGRDIEKNITPTIWFTPDSGTYRTEAVRLRGVISSTPGVAA